MTEEELDAVRQSARKGEPRGEYELAMLYSSDYFKQRAVYTLRALYKGILRIYNAAVSGISSEIKDFLCESVESFKRHPSVDSLNILLASTVQAISSAANETAIVFSSKLMSGIVSLGEALPQILDRHYPEWRNDDEIGKAADFKSGEPSIDALYNLLETITKKASKKGDNTVINKLLADALSKGYQNAAAPLAKRIGYKTKSALFENSTLIPVFDSSDNTAYPAVCLGLAGQNIKATEGRTIKTRSMLDFFTPDASCFFHYISVVYDINSKQSRDAGYSVLQSILASVLAWVGPQKFTLDIIDYEHTGIGAYPAQFLPERQINIISRDTDWNAELDRLELLVEKRSRIMQSIMEYNRNNPDMTEPYKVVVVQDYEGRLITSNKPEGDHPDQKEKDRYEKELKNAKRFMHLLERGYRYGLVFLVGTKKGSYHSSIPVVDCTGTVSVSYPATPYSTIRVDVISHNDPDWLMKWLAGGEDVKRRQRVKASEKMDGAYGILTTEIANDGTEVEFRLDTVSHTHAFVIGKTGSGKSVLLHNVITGLINAYGPDDLMLYLLDLKMGGVEFNRYRHLPHLRSLLVDNSDIQIVLEIMRDIESMMRDRGKKFRDAEVSNIREYNQIASGNKLPQVIVVIDECHVIFSMGNTRGASKYQREITERLSKIAREGRSQGIHLIFSTQTLSGSEIPADIQKNITDFYLLKCAPSDSEQLVRGSSKHTESLPVGHIYYHHADKQAVFQGIYHDSMECEELIKESINRYLVQISHGQFYYNGSQIFDLDKATIDSICKNPERGIVGSPGRRINLQQTPVEINLSLDYGENIITTGINSEEQLSRTTLALMCSQIAVGSRKSSELDVNVINCLDQECGVSKILNEMAEIGCINLVRPSESGSMLRNLCDKVNQKTLARKTILYIFGQERFGELRRNQRINHEKNDADNFVNDAFKGFEGFNPPSSKDESPNFDTYKSALIYLLENGPLCKLHTVIQIDKPDRLLFEDFISAKYVSSRFKHIIILRSELRSANTLGMSDDIMVDNLSADIDRLRAYYYCDDKGSTILFSPYNVISAQSLKTI